MIRQAQHSSNLPTNGCVASTHVAQTLRAHSLRKASHEHVKIPPPFGTFAALRRQGGAKNFGRFENRGFLGRLLLENTTTSRECVPSLLLTMRLSRDLLRNPSSRVRGSTVKEPIPLPKCADCVDEAKLRELCGQVLAYLDEYKLPKQRTRTNVYGDMELDSPRGCLLGCFTRRGFGLLLLPGSMHLLSN
eukprot:375029-Amphidinium_carterae.1